MKVLFLILTVNILIIGCSLNNRRPTQNQKDVFDGSPEIVSDSIHIYLSGYCMDSINNKWVENNVTENYLLSGLEKEKGSVCLGYISFDSKKELTAYFIRNKSQVFLYVYSNSKDQFIFDQIIASAEFLEGAYESTTNSWFFDIDNDGDLDIATWKRLTDYELPNEYADNISGDEMFVHINMGNSFVYDSWNNDLLSTAKLKQ